MGEKMVLVLSFLLILSEIYLQSWAHKENIVNMSMDGVDNNTGNAVNCGTVPIKLSWTPKDLSPSGDVKITLGYKVPHLLDSGFFNASLYFHGDESPFLGYADNFDCSTMKQYGIPCPFKEGLQFTFTKTISNLHVLTSYPGYYDAVIQVWNSKFEEMFCVNLTLKVLEVYNGPEEY